MSQADNSAKNWQNLPMSNSKPNLHNTNAHIKFGENHWDLLVIVLKIKYRCVVGRSLPKIDEICPSLIPNQISTISMHISSLVKIQWYLLKFCLEMKIQKCDGHITLSKIDEICRLAIPNQSPQYQHTLTASLVKIHWHLLKLSSENEKSKWLDGCMTDGWTDRHMDNRSDTIIPCNYPMAGYKNLERHLQLCLALFKVLRRCNVIGRGEQFFTFRVDPFSERR